ncbi:hypothetical protein ACFXAF_12260 [Kitasatospora sp. NPDC059463]|uniref:hypothetical protein n=1 Tax=unclassified Kitasatospora TaxID=2633591 RepID=UPI00369441A2
MSVAGGSPVPDADDRPVELGRCAACGAWTRGAFVRDLTAVTSEVEHCSPDDEPRSTALTAAYGATIAALAVVAVLLIISGIRH